jgi:membrane-associated phospholipid phosphatase
VYADKHWASDVFFGAVLGVAAGRAAARLADERNVKNAYLMPVYGRDFTGALAVVRFY